MPACKYCGKQVVYIGAVAGNKMCLEAQARKVYLAVDIDNPSRLGMARHKLAYLSHPQNCSMKSLANKPD